MIKLEGFWLNTNSLNNEDVWYFLFGEYVSTKKKYCSPFRKDSHPDCKFFILNGDLLFNDFASGKVYSATGALKEYYGCEFKEAVNLFNNRQKEFKSGVLPKREKVSKSNLEIYPYYFNSEPAFSKEGFNYWKEIGVSKNQLDREETRVFNLFAFSFGTPIYTKTPTFAYKFREGRFKIYAPFENKGDKWYSNATKNDYWHLKKNSETLLIEKSNKDFLCIENLVDWDLSCFMNEGAYPNNILDIVKDYDRVIINYDNDETGIREGKALAKLVGGETLFYEGFKDTTEGYLKDIESLKQQLLI